MIERMQQVVERFKEQNRSIPKPKTPQSAPRPVGAVTAEVPPAEVVYSKTRSVRIPPDVFREQRILTAVGEGPFLDAYKMLRTQVMHRLRENNWNVLGVTSPGEGEGKTLTAINLAISIAMEITQTVLLVDADLRNPSAQSLFGLENSRGLADYLLDDVPVQDLLIHPEIGRFVFLPGGRPLSHSTETLTSPKMTALVREFKHRYASRIVVFDLPPLLRAADVLAFSPYADALLLVVEEGHTTVDDVERAVQLVRGATPVLGTVLNKSGRPAALPRTRPLSRSWWPFGGIRGRH
jgi:capsular exopolysaccharide synthesis family protein